MQYDPHLPASINARLRGQDLSAGSHAEWLEQQLQRCGAPEPRSVPTRIVLHSPPPLQPLPKPSERPPAMVGGRLANGANHAQWLDLELQRCARFSPKDHRPVQDASVGSSLHSEWLGSQLTPGREFRPSSSPVLVDMPPPSPVASTACTPPRHLSARPAPSPAVTYSSTGPERTSEQQQHAAWLELNLLQQQLGRHALTSTPAPFQRTGPGEDASVGSPAHAAWLERQLRVGELLRYSTPR